MIAIQTFMHPLEEKAYQEMMGTIAFDREVMFHYVQYTEKARRPDLLGKTVRVSEKQFPAIHAIAVKLASVLQMQVPEIYVYEDFYYGVECKGADQPWIEISAKTITDLSEAELRFLIARALCSIHLKHPYTNTMIQETLHAMQSSGIMGTDTLAQSWTAIMHKWSRTTYYTEDAFGYLACGDLGSAVSGILKLVLNNAFLAEQVHLPEFLQQASDLAALSNDFAQYSKLDEQAPYAPVRIKHLIRYASSLQGLDTLQQLNKRMEE